MIPGHVALCIFIFSGYLRSGGMYGLPLSGLLYSPNSIYVPESYNTVHTIIFSKCTCVRLSVRVGLMVQAAKKKKDTIKCTMDKWFHKTKLPLWRGKTPPGYHYFKTFTSPRPYIVCASPLFIPTFFVRQLRILRFLCCASVCASPVYLTSNIIVLASF